MTVETDVDILIVGEVESDRGAFAVAAANFVGVGADQLFAALLALVPPWELGQVLNTLRLLSTVAQLVVECQNFA